MTRGAVRIPAWGTDIVLSVRFREREHSGAALAGSVPLQFCVQHRPRSDPGA